MFRLRWVLAVVALFFLAGVAVPRAVFAQDGERSDDDVLIRINGPLLLRAEERADVVFVISDNAVIDGEVTHDVVVIRGNALINGRIGGNVTMINGDLTLGPTAFVGEDVHLYRAKLTRDPGAVLTGTVNEEWDGFGVSAGAVWRYLWVSMTTLVLVAGLTFAAFGGRQMREAAGQIGAHTGETVLTTVVLTFGIPALAVAAFLTVIGVPLGFGLLFFVIPALWFFGYLVAGAALGALFLRRTGGAVEAGRPYLAVLLGLLAFQLVGFIPFIGGLVVFVAGQVGAGALAYRMWKQWRGPATSPMPAPRPTPA